MSEEVKEKQHKEEEEGDKALFNNAEKCVGMIYILENIQQRFELTEIEREIIEYAKKLINDEYEETVDDADIDIGEEEDSPIKVPKGAKVGVEGIVKGLKQGEVYGYA